MHTALLQHVGRGKVVDVTGREDAMQIETGEAELDEATSDFGGVALAPRRACEDVADVALLVGLVPDADATAPDELGRHAHVGIGTCENGKVPVGARGSGPFSQCPRDEGMRVRGLVWAPGHEPADVGIRRVGMDCIELRGVDLSEDQTLGSAFVPSQRASARGAKRRSYEKCHR